MVQYIMIHEYTYLFMISKPMIRSTHGWSGDGMSHLSYAYETVFNKQKKLCPIRTIW